MSSYLPYLADSEISVLVSSFLSGSHHLSTNSMVKSFLKDLLIWKWNAYNIKKSYLIKKIICYCSNSRFSMFMMISISNLMTVFLIIHENMISDNIKSWSILFYFRAKIVTSSIDLSFLKLMLNIINTHLNFNLRTALASYPLKTSQY